MATAPAGIPRSRGALVQLLETGGITPAALRRDINTLFSAMQRIQNRLNLVDDQLSKRINEMLLSGVLADLPTPGVQDRLFFVSSAVAPLASNLLYDFNGVWVPIGSGAGTIENGTVTFVAGVTTMAVTFGSAQPDTNYRVTLGLGPGLGSPGLTSYGWANKTVNGFDFQIGVDPGIGNTFIGDWTLAR